jgi:hypothetical protein
MEAVVKTVEPAESEARLEKLYLERKATLGVIGMGYVGLPLARRPRQRGLFYPQHSKGRGWR